MSRLRKPWKISTLLYLLLFVMVVVPLTTLSTIILQVYKRDLLAQTTNRTLQTLHSITYTAEQETRKVMYITANIGTDQEILTNATQMSQADSGKNQTNIDFLNSALTRYNASINNYILSVSFFFKHGGVFSYNRNLIEDSNVIHQTDWYAKTLTNSNQVHFIGLQKNVLFDSGKPYVITAAVSPEFIPGLQTVELIYCAFNRSSFENLLRGNQTHTVDSDFLIVDKNRQVIASSYGLSNINQVDEHLYEKINNDQEGHFVSKLDNTSMLVTYATVPNTGWKVIHQIPYSQLTQTYDQIFKAVIIFTIVCTCVFLMISFSMVRNLTKPIHLMVRKMTSVVGGNLNARIAASGSAEMVTLGHTFNYMLDHIHLLILQNKEEERAKRIAEFDALQSQINPHFLINTLNVIKLIALVNKVDNIRNITVALMKLVSSAFNRGSTLNPLSEEIENLKHYLYIMENRFGKKISVEWHVAEETSSLFILKLLLQPIVENCIVHGLDEKDIDGQILVKTSIVEGSLHIEIADNGVGMEKEQRNSFMNQNHENKFSGMGISNVNRRIQLQYGAQFGLTIQPNEPEGTKIVIRVPLLTTRSQDNDLQQNGV
ncbi:sensor histidine kinase [Paenibacillus sp. GCM10023248]|uniref:cache domain-containing sensor histidine kinase n=1 Tax=Bacillales TaxID=1385 RepID=UPI0023799FF8|nr:MULTISPECIES: sensor histidine kinase [Bacillales]MDD9265486.1 sensor histidine kinase [Paenibacillus sp. MAHUQ-63]MDR6882478.1 two-component system sensor histidine kinase YesM [Bacillus sp. 3255]